ncbi:hypothetical protein HMPREF1548_02631 [Clostridium sp. KLE 1755]|jgi:hypothetical protein|nr:hypothetical protein HMPREF1548_02631 [Clostridium sp. KLE 1755]
MYFVVNMDIYVYDGWKKWENAASSWEEVYITCWKRKERS